MVPAKQCRRADRERARLVGGQPNTAKISLNRETLPKFISRVQALRADTPRQWGTMDTARAVRHLIFTFEASLGIKKIEKRLNPVARAVLYFVFFEVFTTWPKGLKGPDYITPPPERDFISEQQELVHLMEQFVVELERNPARIEVNPGLGGLPLSKWSRAHGVHTDHHMRQFGV